MFIDLDNFSNIFEKLPAKRLPETLYIVGFNGGDKNWKARHSVALHHHVQNGLFALVRCGTDKDAADKDLVTLVIILLKVFYFLCSFGFLERNK
jgi:hypothetical protein